MNLPKLGSREGGITLVELVVALAAAGLLTGMVGYFFTRQSRNYLDMQEQSRLQANLKKAQAIMSREITSAGAGLANPASAFTMNYSSLTFSYLDLNGKHCNANDVVTLDYRVATAGAGSNLQRRRQCNGGPYAVETMVACDSASLEFWYMDANRNVTGNPVGVRMIQYRVQIYTRNNRAAFKRIRTGIVQVWLGAMGIAAGP